MPLLTQMIFMEAILVVGLVSPSVRGGENRSLTCQNIVLPMKDGATYTGVVRNEDYRFTAIIPPGRKAWGVAPPAPFHGFVLFLDGNGRHREGDSCVDFEVGVRVILPGDDSKDHAEGTTARPVTVGNRTGSETIIQEEINGSIFVIANVRLDLARSISRSDYVSLTFVSPIKTYTANRKIFDRFMSGLTFW